ncbi:FtsX-like permease family protein [Plantactinospora solaniradicis]|uniref:FtsX-like permease family protein n=1 Tax=Plantactinospora solaniradicis TaxID=1723736 RepID=A0ABW1K975_9ACTN
MLRLLGLRARAQWPLLAALLAVVALGATLLGTCALLITSTADRAYEVAAARAAPGDVGVTAYTVAVPGAHASSVAADTRELLTSTLAPFAATTATRASSALRTLPANLAGRTDVPTETYLSAMDDLPARTTLVEGRWPRAVGGAGSVEAVLLEPTARLLGLTLGSRVRLGAELNDAPAPAIDVTVVGVVRPLPGAGWDRDPLGGAGYDLAFSDGRQPQLVHAYGPLVVDLADLLSGSHTIDRMEITADPDLSTPARHDLEAVAGAVRGADRRLAGILGDRVRIENLASPLPQTLLTAREQQRVTAATVLAVALLGAVLTATALALASRLTAGIRADETGLLSTLGFSRGRLAAGAAVEGGTLALLAAALAVPASSLLHAGLTRLPPLAGAGLAGPPAVTVPQVLVVGGGVLALAAVLVTLAARPAATVGDRRAPRALLARSSADVLLLAFAAVGLWQLHAQATGADSRIDAVRVVAPTLLLTAGAALALRLVPPALHGAERLARRARGLALPLAAFEAARRPRAVAAGLLIGLACGAGTFGIALGATWERSQHDQADLSVGTDLEIALTTSPVAGQGAAVSAATGGAVSPATGRGVAIGQWLGTAGDAPRLVAVDTARAEALLRGRLDGDRSWAEVGAALAPPSRVGGVALPAGAALALTGTATGATPVLATPRLLLQDATGLRTTCTGGPVPLDGAVHRLPECVTADGLELVAASLRIAADPSAGPAGPERSRVAVTLTAPGAVAPNGAPPWTAISAPPAPGQLTDPAVAFATTASGTELRMTTAVQFTGPQDAARDLVATAFPVPGTVPVAASARLLDELGVRPGSSLSIAVGNTAISVVVAEAVPEVPSAPGAAAILADLDVLSRALVVAGNFQYPVDGWWVGDPDRTDAAARAAALHIGTVTTRAGETARLSEGPLRASLPAALRLLVPAAALLLVAGVVLHVLVDLRTRAVEVARLRGLGMTRREVRALLFGQYAGVLLPLLLTGTAVGALATLVVAPPLVRSDLGAAPVPPVVAYWPWSAEAALLAPLLVACLLAVAVVVVVRTRRPDAGYLRVSS